MKKPKGTKLILDSQEKGCGSNLCKCEESRMREYFENNHHSRHHSSNTQNQTAKQTFSHNNRHQGGPDYKFLLR
jgi:hypothetical protein